MGGDDGRDSARDMARMKVKDTTLLEGNALELVRCQMNAMQYIRKRRQLQATAPTR